MFARNQWYVAAWAQDVADKPLGRRILGEPIVLFRDASGKLAALEDRCCHRAFPLSRGEVVDGNLQCGYHGLEYDTTGRCVRIPGQPNIPSAYRVRSYPVEEQDALVWIWMGDPSAAHASEITRFPFHNDSKGWPARTATKNIKCNYRRIIDNLLDLTHLGFVHKSTIGGNPGLHVNAEMIVTPTETGVKFIRWLLDAPPPPLFDKFMEFKGNVDRWLEFEFVAPGSIHQFTGALDAGTGAYDKGKRDGGFALRMFHGITPETDRSSWYFFSSCAGFCQDEPSKHEALWAGTQTAYGEDVRVLEAQEERLSETPHAPLMALRSDVARIHAERFLDQLIEEDGAATRSHSLELSHLNP